MKTNAKMLLQESFWQCTLVFGYFSGNCLDYSLISLKEDMGLDISDTPLPTVSVTFAFFHSLLNSLSLCPSFSGSLSVDSSFTQTLISFPLSLQFPVPICLFFFSFFRLPFYLSPPLFLISNLALLSTTDVSWTPEGCCHGNRRRRGGACFCFVHASRCREENRFGVLCILQTQMHLHKHIWIKPRKAWG